MSDVDHHIQTIGHNRNANNTFSLDGVPYFKIQRPDGLQVFLAWLTNISLMVCSVGGNGIGNRISNSISYSIPLK